MADEVLVTKKVSVEEATEAIEDLRKKGADINPYSLAEHLKVSANAIVSDGSIMELLSISRGDLNGIVAAEYDRLLKRVEELESKQVSSSSDSNGEQEIASLRQQLEELKAEYESLKEKTPEDLRKEIEELKEELEMWQDENSQLEERLENSLDEEQLSELNRKLLEVVAINSDLREQLESAASHEEVEELNKELLELVRTNTSLREKVENLEKAEKAPSSDSSDAIVSAELNKSLEEQVAKILELNTVIEQQSDKLAELNNMRGLHADQISDLDKQLFDLRTLNLDLLEKYKALEAQNAELQVKISESYQEGYEAARAEFAARAAGTKNKSTAEHAVDQMAEFLVTPGHTTVSHGVSAGEEVLMEDGSQLIVNDSMAEGPIEPVIEGLLEPQQEWTASDAKADTQEYTLPNYMNTGLFGSDESEFVDQTESTHGIGSAGEHVQYDLNAGIDPVQYDPNAGFDPATYDPNAEVEHAAYDPNAGIEHATYEQNAGLEHAGYDPNALIEHAAYEQNAGLEHAGYDPNAGIEHAAYEQNAGLEHAGYDPNALIEHAAYEQNAGLEHAGYDPNALIEQAAYEQNAGLDHAAYDPNAGIEHAAYDPNAALDPVAYDPYSGLAPSYDASLGQDPNGAHDPHAAYTAYADPNGVYDSPTGVDPGIAYDPNALADSNAAYEHLQAQDAPVGFAAGFGNPDAQFEPIGHGETDPHQVGASAAESNDVENSEAAVKKPAKKTTSAFDPNELRNLVQHRLEKKDEPAAEPEATPKLHKFVGGKNSGQETHSTSNMPRVVSQDIRRACKLLGLLPEELSRQVVHDAWKREMSKPGVHPDTGGNTEEATFLNTAKDTLLRYIDAQAPKLGKVFGSKSSDQKDNPRGDKS